MYQKIGEISEEARQWLLKDFPRLKHVRGPETDGHATDYQSIKLDLRLLEHPEVMELIPRDRWIQSIGVGLEPGWALHRHTHDLERDQGKCRYHIVLKTNDECECWNGDKPYKLEDRGVYWMEPYLPHESFNRGETDRLHIILVTSEQKGNHPEGL